MTSPVNLVRLGSKTPPFTWPGDEAAVGSIRGLFLLSRICQRLKKNYSDVFTRL